MSVVTILGLACTPGPSEPPVSTTTSTMSTTTSAPVTSTTSTAPTTTTTTVPSGNHLSRLLAASSRNKSPDDQTYVNKPSLGLENDPFLYGQQYIQSYADSGTVPEISNDPFGEFRAECDFSHFAYDDPSLMPGQPGKRHLHMFFGNTHANAYSDYDSIINSGNSTCNGRELNRSVYWTAAVIDQDGNPRKPIKIMVYYKSYSLEFGKANPFPENLQLASVFNACTNNTLTWQQIFQQGKCNSYEERWTNNREINHSAQWYCQNPASAGTMNDRTVIWPGGQHVGVYAPIDQTQIPACPTTTSLDESPVTVLQEHIVFPYCLKNGNSRVGMGFAQQKAETSYNNEWSWFYSKCPASHPYKIPQIEYRIFYPIYPGDDTSKWYTSMDIDPMTGAMKDTKYRFFNSDGSPVVKTARNGAQSHGGWIGGWNRSIMESWVQSCNNVAGADCVEGIWPLPVGPQTKALVPPNRTPKNPIASQWFADRGWYTLKYNDVWKVDGQKLHSEICGRPKLFTQTASMPKGADITHCLPTHH